MKRRDFFTKVALGTAAVVVAPHILAQEPVKALNPYRKVLSNPAYHWVKAKRSEVHTGDNNYWKCLDKARTGVRWTQIETQWPVHTVRFREYDWVYQVNHPHFNYMGCDELNYIRWMNVEDFSFYESLKGKRVFDPHHTNLLGVGLVPGLLDPLNPRIPRAATVPYRMYQNGDSYEIHIMYQKLK